MNESEEYIEKLVELCEHLSDHFWQRNNLDFDFLKEFPEFTFEGVGFRCLWLESKDVYDMTNQSFSKTLNGIKQFLDNVKNYDKDFIENKSPYLFKAKIIGFDVPLALSIIKKNDLIICENFINEEEVLSFNVYNVEEITLNEL